MNNVNTFGNSGLNGTRGLHKVFENALTGLVYVKTSAYIGLSNHTTTVNSTLYTLKNTAEDVVFEFGGLKGNNAATNRLWFTGKTAEEVELGNGESWFDIEFVLNLDAKTAPKVVVTYNGVSKTFTDISLSNGDDIKRLDIALGRGNNALAENGGAGGFDNTTFGQLIADTIKNLAGAETVQAMVDNPVSSEYAVTTFSYVMDSDFDIPKADMDVVWSISDYGTLSDEDKARVSLVRSETDFSKAILSIGSIEAGATIRLQALFGNAVLTKDVELKSPDTDALKATLQEEITKAEALRDAVTDNNSFITDLKATLTNVISSAKALIEDEDATLSALGTAITTLQTSETVFSDAIAPYNEFVAYIATVQAAYDAEVREAAFFTVIKSALQTAITAATGARSTIASAEDITTAKSALEAALTQFNTDVPAYASLESAIAAVTSRITDVTPRIGSKFLNYRQDKVTKLTEAETTAKTALTTNETATALTESAATLNSALATFNETGRIAPGTGPYKIYTYGIAEGDGDEVKKIIFSDLNEDQENYIVKYSDNEEEAVNAEWIIAQTAPNVYTIKNNTLPGTWYIAGATLTSGVANLTISENTGRGSEIYKDEGYFLYGILTSSNKALEVAANGVIKASNGIAARLRFAFQFEEIAVTGVTLNKTAETLNIGKTLSLKATVAPANATNPAITWSTSDEAVATVSETGLVTAVSVGTATITVTTEDGGFTATCEITVTDDTGMDKIQAGELNVYPNPVKNKLFIQSKTPVQSATVFHIGGAPVKQVNREVSSIDMQDLSTGLYLVKLVTGQGDIWIKTMKR
jgi:uncharacterized protein YjdB